jgi:hypothetical protein
MYSRYFLCFNTIFGYTNSIVIYFLFDFTQQSQEDLREDILDYSGDTEWTPVTWSTDQSDRKPLHMTLELGGGSDSSQRFDEEDIDKCDNIVDTYDLDNHGQLYHNGGTSDYSPVPPPRFIFIPSDLHGDELESLALICSYGNTYSYDLPTSLDISRYPNMEMASIKEEDEYEVEEAASEVEESEANSELDDENKQTSILPNNNQERLLDFGVQSVACGTESDMEETDCDGEEMDANTEQSAAGIVDSQVGLGLVAHSGISQSDSSINSHNFTYTYGNQVEYRADSDTNIKETVLDASTSSNLSNPAVKRASDGRNSNFINGSFDSEEGLPDDSVNHMNSVKTKRSLSADMTAMPNGLRGFSGVPKLKKNKLCHGLSLQEDYLGQERSVNTNHSTVPKKTLVTHRRSLPGDCMIVSNRLKQAIQPRSCDKDRKEEPDHSNTDFETTRMLPRLSISEKAGLVPCSTMANECNEETLLLSPSEEAEPLFV